MAQLEPVFQRLAELDEAAHRAFQAREAARDNYGDLETAEAALDEANTEFFNYLRDNVPSLIKTHERALNERDRLIQREAERMQLPELDVKEIERQERERKKGDGGMSY